MLHPTRSPRAFTLIEMLVVMAVIAILAAIVLSVNGFVQSKAARSRAEAEIKTLQVGIASYQADNGSVPEDSATTDKLDPRVSGNPTDPTYNSASLVLYRALSGDNNNDGRLDTTDGNYTITGTAVTPTPTTPTVPKNYLPDYFTPQHLGTTMTNGVISKVLYLKDPYGNSYGYSTAAALAEQTYRTAAASDPNAIRKTSAGFNGTYDLWSTGGKVSNPVSGDLGKSNDIINIWIKNW